jgi:hypothetical protein
VAESRKVELRARSSIGAVLAEQYDFLVLLLLASIIIFEYALQPRPVWVPFIDWADDSWKLDLIAKANHGIWLGKGAIFNYGPLFQWLISVVPRDNGSSLGAYYSSVTLFLFLTAMLPLFLAQRILLRRQRGWLRAFYFALLVIFWLPILPSLLDVKIIFPLCAFAVFLWCAEEATGGARSVLLSLVATAFLMAAWLLSPEAGTYSSLGLLLAIAAHGVHRERRRNELVLLGFTAVLSLAGVLLTNAVTFGPRDFTFWKRYAATLGTYRWSQAIAMPQPVAVTALAIAGVSALLIAATLLRSTRRPSAAYILAICLFAVATMQSGIVVGEGSHVALAMFPAIVLGSAVFLGAGCEQLRNERMARSVGVLLLITALVSGPHRDFRPHAIWFAAAHGPRSLQCPAGLAMLQDACVGVDDAEKAVPVAEFIDQNVSSDRPVVIFPNDNVYGFVAQRRVAGLIEQNYVAAGDGMQRAQIESYERDRAPAAIYSADGLATSARGGISNFVRTPLVWLYVQQHYRAGEDLLLGTSGLLRDDKRAANISQQVTPIPVQASVTAVRAGELIPIANVPQPQQGADFFRLRMKVDYPFWWRVLKPAQTIVHLSLADGSEKLIPVIAEPNAEYEVWIYPWNEAQLMNYFSPDPKVWRSGTRPAVTKVAIEFKRFDAFSVLPKTAEFEKLEAVTLQVKQ